MASSSMKCFIWLFAVTLSSITVLSATLPGHLESTTITGNPTDSEKGHDHHISTLPAWLTSPKIPKNWTAATIRGPRARQDVNHMAKQLAVENGTESGTPATETNPVAPSTVPEAVTPSTTRSPATVTPTGKPKPQSPTASSNKTDILHGQETLVERLSNSIRRFISFAFGLLLTPITVFSKKV